jgi:polar amino acid transport system permease protein
MRGFTLQDVLTIAAALRWTLVLVALSLAVGAPFALLLALARTARTGIWRWVATGFLQIVQGVPVLGLIMFFYFGLPVLSGIQVSALASVTVAFALYTAAFLGEIWRGAIQAIPAAQGEAGACLGLTGWEQFRHVIGPQALRLALPATVGFLVQLVKNTSLASIVGFVELARAGQIASAATFQPLAAYACVAAIYFALCFPLTLWSRSLEDRLNGAR